MAYLARLSVAPRTGLLTPHFFVRAVLQDDPASGGQTAFPRARPVGGGSAGALGVTVTPRKGRALLFWSVRLGAEDEASLHEALPVGVGATKHIATRWLAAVPAR